MKGIECETEKMKEVKMKRKDIEGRAITVGTERVSDSVRLRKGRFSVSEGYQQLLTILVGLGLVACSTRQERDLNIFILKILIVIFTLTILIIYDRILK